jgi:hypothetical protein
VTGFINAAFGVRFAFLDVLAIPSSAHFDAREAITIFRLLFLAESTAYVSVSNSIIT